MKCFGFSELFVSIICNCLKNQFISICLNGQRKGFFPTTRELRQRDPITSSLFILAEEVLSRGLSKLYADGGVKAFHTGRGIVLISHMLFADDTLLFLRGNKPSLEHLFGFLSKYEQSSGQRISKQKSSLICSARISQGRKLALSRLAQIPLKECPLTYLGCPLIKGRSRLKDFEEVVLKFKAKLEGWYAKLLSNMGRVILVQSVLNVVPIHLLSCLNLPKGILERLNSLMASFIWSGKGGVRKRHWISWSDLTKPKQEGGLGIRKLEDVQAAFRLK